MLAEQEKVKAQLNRIFNIYTASEGVVRPHFVLTGPSGSGKSFMVQVMVEEFNVNYLEVNAAQLTKEGTSGNSLSKALSPLQNSTGALTVVFVDEFDKLFISGNSNTHLAHETTNGVQNEFLRVLEGNTTSVFGDYGKYVDIPINRVLFVFAGAFNGEENISLDRLRSFGIKTEFLGRVGLIYNLKKLSVKSLYIALQNSSLLKNYLELFPTVERKDAEEAIMTVVAANFENNTLGIRLLHTLINQYFINDGHLSLEEAQQSSFQTALTFGTTS